MTKLKCPDCGQFELTHEAGDRWQCAFCGSRAVVSEQGSVRPWLSSHTAGRKRKGFRGWNRKVRR